MHFWREKAPKTMLLPAYLLQLKKKIGLLQETNFNLFFRPNSIFLLELKQSCLNLRARVSPYGIAIIKMKKYASIEKRISYEIHVKF